MFCTLPIQAILVKSPICPSNTTFPIVDIVNKGIQKSKEERDPSRHLVIQLCFLHPFFLFHKHIHTLAEDNHLKTATEMNASSRNTNKCCVSAFQAFKFPPCFIHKCECMHSHKLRAYPFTPNKKTGYKQPQSSIFVRQKRQNSNLWPELE